MTTPWAQEDKTDFEELVEDGTRYRRRLQQEHDANMVGCAWFHLLQPIYNLPNMPEPVTKAVGKKYGDVMRAFNQWCRDLENKVEPDLGSVAISSCPVSSPIYVCAYLHELLKAGATKRELQNSVKAISYSHLRLGHPDPTEHVWVTAIISAAGKSTKETN